MGLYPYPYVKSNVDKVPFNYRLPKILYALFTLFSICGWSVNLESIFRRRIDL